MEKSISTDLKTSQDVGKRASMVAHVMMWPRIRRLFSRMAANRRIVRWSLLLVNIALLGGITFFILDSQSGGSALSNSAITTTSSDSATEPLDQLSSADIAVSAAIAAGLPETTAVNNQADSVAAELTVAPADTTVIAKPQTVLSAFKSSKDIKSYVVKEGDTVSSIARKFNITSDSIMWSNGLTGNFVATGVRLVIPPLNGIVYTVKRGDTINSLSQKYRVSTEQLIAINDIELTGLRAGRRILLPNGQQPAPVYAFQAVAIYGPYNGYDFGFCTWYVADRRGKAGNPLPSNLGNANTWDGMAAALGLAVGRSPSVGAAAVTSHYGAGHVAYVEAVAADGSIWVSEMNSYGQASMTDSSGRGGWGVVDWKHVPASRAVTYNYIR